MTGRTHEGLELDGVGSSSARRWFAATAIVAVLVIVTAGWGLLTDGFDPYRGRAWCKGQDVDASIRIQEPWPPALAATPEGAIATFAADPTVTVDGDPVPAEGWHEHRGRWILDLTDDRHLELTVQELAGGWIVSDLTMACAR